MPRARIQTGVIAVCLASSLILPACDESAKKAVRVQVPEVKQPAEPLLMPLPASERAQSASLSPVPKSSVDVLLAYVEEGYRSGEESYRAGHLGRARKEFDRAVDALLASGIELSSDPRLEAAFDRIVEAVHRYELSAFREGDGFFELRAEPAPIDEIAEMAGPVDPKLRERVALELKDVEHDMPLMVTDEVVAFLNFFQTPRGRAIVENGLRRAGRYREMISRVLREEGVPQDLIYLAQAESGFQPSAVSRAHAVGMWQFVAGTGHLYGLRRNWWVDERRDPEKSTRAAARHLRDLYDAFGDWYLAMAAYNSGAGNVTKGIERTGYADFWELHRRNALPRETKNYVPIILALTIVAKESERYGIRVEPGETLEVDRVRPGRPIDLRLVAETIDTSVEQLRELNPHLLRLVTPADPEFELILPRGTAEHFQTDIAAIPPEKWVSWRRHRVEEGETLSGIARRYRIQPSAIAEANGLETGSVLPQGTKLIIPATAPTATSGEGKLVRYRVRRGDTLPLIAEQFSVSVAEIKSWNRLASDKVARGATLRIYPGGRPEPASVNVSARGKKPAAARPGVETVGGAPGATPRTHAVARGETLFGIAQVYGITVDTLRRANSFLRARPLRAGDRLLIPPSQ